jgi:hypothetical protein
MPHSIDPNPLFAAFPNDLIGRRRQPINQDSQSVAAADRAWDK